MREAGESLETLVQTLLWEGYALYPYTSGATHLDAPGQIVTELFKPE